MVQPREQNAPRKLGEASSGNYTHGEETERPIKNKVAWLGLQSGLVAPWCDTSRPFSGCLKPWATSYVLALSEYLSRTSSVDNDVKIQRLERCAFALQDVDDATIERSNLETKVENLQEALQVAQQVHEAVSNK